ncbi:hypothetical protein [Fluviicola sp.]|uniref:hypothetical protein n=1 Tax=Fluviicola sp. TaxID=1917219 RepID=UPI002612AD9D|nr:hypothetical protein [Fluviicola sp.]
MKNLTDESKITFRLNGVKMKDNRTKLESILNQHRVSFRVNYPLVNDQEQVEYICTGYKYKLQKDQVVGFALTNTNVSKQDIIHNLGNPTKVTPIIGEIFSMDLFEIEGYIWEYDGLKLEVTFDEKELAAEAFHVGKKLYYFDN